MLHVFTDLLFESLELIDLARLASQEAQCLLVSAFPSWDQRQGRLTWLSHGCLGSELRSSSLKDRHCAH